MKRRNRWILSITLLIVIAVLIGNIALFNALPKSERLKAPLTLDYGTSDVAFRLTMGQILQQPIVGGNNIDILRDGEEIYPAMIEAINAAEHSVTYETFEFWGEASAGALADALAEAAQRGVKVHALPDHLGSVLADTEKFERMEEAGVELHRWREPSWYQMARFNHRTHRKLLMVDGKTGFTGGANHADNWLEDVGDDHYRDNHFRVTGPVVANMQSVFAETWLDATGNLLHGRDYFPEAEETGTVEAQVVKSSPREGRHRMRLKYLYAIAAAEDKITASTAYFYPDPEFLEALTAAAKRGVDVRILVPGDSIDQGYIRQASINRWEPMLEAGVDIYEYQPRMYHAKLMSIDDRWASVGSSNLDNRSFRINDEANLAIWDDAMAAEIRELIEEDLDKAELYTLGDWQSRPWYLRFFGRFGQMIGAHL